MCQYPNQYVVDKCHLYSHDSVALWTRTPTAAYERTFPGYNLWIPCERNLCGDIVRAHCNKEHGRTWRGQLLRTYLWDPCSQAGCVDSWRIVIWHSESRPPCVFANRFFTSCCRELPKHCVSTIRNNVHTSSMTRFCTLRFRGLPKYCVFTIKTDVVVKWDSTLRFRGLPMYCVFTIKTAVIVKWDVFKERKYIYFQFLNWKHLHFTMTVVLIVKTQYFGSPRNRKVESHFTTTSVLIVKTQYFGSPRNRKVKNPDHRRLMDVVSDCKNTILWKLAKASSEKAIMEDARRPWFASPKHYAPWANTASLWIWIPQAILSSCRRHVLPFSFLPCGLTMCPHKLFSHGSPRL